MTDPQVVSSLLKINEHDQANNRALIDEILEEFLVGLAQYVTPEEPPTVLPGVRQILKYCHTDPNCYLGLVTGNMAVGAHIKLTACQLYPYFPVGAFGSDNADRHKLPPLAVERAESYYQKIFHPHDTWIIGDSINDLSMLSVVDIPILVQRPGSYWEEIDLPKLKRVKGIGPKGWNEAVQYLLDCINP